MDTLIALTYLLKNDNNNSLAVIRENPGELAPELSETLNINRWDCDCFNYLPINLLCCKQQSFFPYKQGNSQTWIIDSSWNIRRPSSAMDGLNSSRRLYAYMILTRTANASSSGIYIQQQQATKGPLIATQLNSTRRRV